MISLFEERVPPVTNNEEEVEDLYPFIPFQQLELGILSPEAFWKFHHFFGAGCIPCDVHHFEMGGGVPNKVPKPPMYEEY